MARLQGGRGARGGDAGNTARLSVGFILADRFTLSALSLFVDHLRLAADEGDKSRPILARWSILGATDRPVVSSSGIPIARTAPLGDPAEFDYVVVVGGLLLAGPQVDTASIMFLRRAATLGVPLAGLCTGSFVLARAGLMTGRRCCVSWFHHQDFLSEFPGHTPISDRLYVIDGDRITCAGGGGVADLATHLIETHIGRSAAQKSRHVLLLDRARAGADAQPYPPLAEGITDERVRRALLIMEQNLAEPVAIAVIAARLRLSTRQLERLFRTVVGVKPGEVYRRLRLRYALFLLATTRRSVTEIALDSGFSDGAHFSRQFKAVNGMSPSDARRIEQAAPASRAVPSLAGPRLFE